MINTTSKTSKWYRGGNWGIQSLDKESPEYYAVQNHRWKDKLKYRIEDLNPSGIKDIYDPLNDTPKAYLDFIRLDSLTPSKGTKHCISEVLRFIQEYGPLWHPFKGGLGNIPPLTIERILVEAQRMASVVKIYATLQNLESRKYPEIEVIEVLRHLMANGQLIPAKYRGYLEEYPDGIREPVDIFDRKTGQFKVPPLNHDNEIVTAATVYVLASVNDALADHPVYPGIGNRTDQQNSSFGAWIQIIYYWDLISVLWWQVYNLIINRSCLRVCKNTKCGRVFEPERGNKYHCSSRCQNSANVRNFFRRNPNKRQR